MIDDPLMKDVRAGLNRMIREFHADQQRAEVRRIEADPKAHKLTLIMGPKGSNYRYVRAGKDGRG